jgi:uncharacterized protein YcbK (DUF882 family)
VNPKMIELAQAIRNRIGAYTPNSAYRCPTHNQEIGGTQMSQHMAGNAIDVPQPQDMESADFYDIILQSLHEVGIDPYKSAGIGEYNSFIHVDIRKEKARWNG